MPRKVIIPKVIVTALGALDLDRELRNRICLSIHDDLPNADRSNRFTHDDRCFVFQKSLLDSRGQHLFVIIVDDCTSPDALIVQDIAHVLFEDL